MKTKTIITSLLLAATMSSQAQDSPSQDSHDNVDLLLTAGFAMGGDDLADIEYDYGSDDKIEAGSGVILGIGAIFAIPDTMLDAQFSVNYHGDNANADNGDVSMERTAIDALLFYHVGPHRIGAGITRHSNIKYEQDIDYVADVNVDFDDATGFVIEYNYIFNNFFALGVRRTEIEYDAKGFDNTVDASHFALLIDFMI